MCLTNESKSPSIKPQYENGEIVCWVVAFERSDGTLDTTCNHGKYLLGKRMAADRRSFGEYYGRHAYLRRQDAENTWLVHDRIIRATVKPKDVIAFGETDSKFSLDKQLPALRAKAMYYEKVVS